MDMSEVKAFNAELSALYDNKPPISKAKMSAITRGAIKAIKFYKHVVHSVEKFIQKCKPEYKVPGLYVIDSIVRQSRHQFGQDKDVFAPRFAKNMQQTFANLFRCPPEDKRNIIRVLNLWQKNNVFSSQVIQPLLDMADPNHPLHQEIQQQQNNTANGSSLNLSHNTSDGKLSPMPPPLHTPPSTTPLGDQFQDQSSNQGSKFNRKLLNDFEYESEDEAGADAAHSHSSAASLASHAQHSQTQADALGSILTNPEITRQLQNIQAAMQMMTGMQMPNLMTIMSDLQMPQNQNQGLPFMSSQQESQKQNEQKDDMVESDIEFVETGPQVIEIPDANDSSPSPRGRRHRSRSKSPRRRRRSRSRSPRRRRDRDRDREKDRDRDKDREKSHKEREADREKQKEREKKGLPPIKKENLSVCSTTLWVGHLSKLATPEELSDLFGGVGGVCTIDVVAPRGCAFVVMERRRDAAKAIAKLNKHKLHSKEITVAWAPGKGVKGREWKDYWEAELGVSYLPWAALHARWSHAALSLDALEDGGAVDEDTLPPWLPSRILPKTMVDNMSMLGMPGAAGGMLVPGMPPAGMPLPSLPNMAPSLPPQNTIPMPRMPPPGMTAAMPPNLAASMPGMRPGMPGVPGPLIRFPPGMPPQSMAQPGMVGGFLGGLLGVGGLVGGHPLPGGVPGLQAGLQAGLPLLHTLQHPADTHAQRTGEVSQSDDAMDLDPEDGHAEDNTETLNTDTSTQPPALLPDQIQALLSKPPPNFNASEPPPNFNVESFQQEDKDDDRKDRDRDRRDRDRRDRPDRRDRDRNDRDRDRNDRRDRDRRDGRERDRDREDRRDRDRDRGRDRRDRDRDRDRDRFNNRDNNNRERSREQSPRSQTEGNEKSLQERLWEMANGKPREEKREDEEEKERPPLIDRLPTVRNEQPMDNERGTWSAPHGPPGPTPARAELRMRGPPRQPMPGAWMDGPGPGPGPGLGPFGPRFNGMGPPPFNRPPFDGPRPPFDGPMFERPPFARMSFDGMNRPPFDGPRPPFDGMRLPFDGPRPPFDGPRPPFDGPRPPFDGPRPPLDGRRPPFDGNRPQSGPRSFDGPRPPFDGPRPPFDGPRPPFDNRRGHEDNRPPFDGPPRFDGPPDFYDQRQRRFDDQYNDRGWNDRDREQWGDRRGDWDDRRRDRRQRDDDRFRDRPDRRRSYDERGRRDENNPRDDRNASRDDRNTKDDRNIMKDDTNPPNEEVNVPKEEENIPKEEKPRREERRDRKSRWGAADAPTESLPIEQVTTENIVSAEQVTENVPNIEQISTEKVEVPSESVNIPSAVQSSHQPTEPEPVQQENQMECEMETSHESHETALEIEKESTLYSPVQENQISIEPPAMDLYDAGDAIDTSFSEAPKASPPPLEIPAREKPEIDNDMFCDGDKAETQSQATAETEAETVAKAGNAADAEA